MKIIQQNSVQKTFFIYNHELHVERKTQKKRSVQTGSETPNFVATQMNFLSNQHNEDVETLQRNFNYILCQVQNEIQFNQKLLSKLYPSEVLSRYLKVQRDAASYGDVIIEKTYKRASLTLIRSLQLNSESYAIRPVAYYTIRNKSKLYNIRWEMCCKYERSRRNQKQQDL